jgi:hypothetical protein
MPLTRALIKGKSQAEVDVILSVITCIPRQEFANFEENLQHLTNMKALVMVGNKAFQKAGNATAGTTVDLSSSSLLEKVGVAAFDSFPGKVRMVGPFANLTDLDGGAFRGASNPNNNVVLTCVAPAGLTVAETAFFNFEGTHEDVWEDCGCGDLCAPSTGCGSIHHSRTGVSFYIKSCGCTSPTPETAVPLTRALIEGKSQAEVDVVTATITCIPCQEFANYDTTMKKLTYMPLLVRVQGYAFQNGGVNAADVEDWVVDFSHSPLLYAVEDYAFDSYKGRVIMKNNKAMVLLGSHAFQKTGWSRTDSLIDLSSSSLLAYVPGDTFSCFAGEIQMYDMKSLVRVGAGAFQKADCVDSVVDLTGSLLLETVEKSAFYRFSGQIRMIGPFDRLADIAMYAFAGASNPSNTVLITCVATGGLTIETDAFTSFRGTNFMGDHRNCTHPCVPFMVAMLEGKSQAEVDVIAPTITHIVSSGPGYENYNTNFHLKDMQALVQVGDHALQKVGTPWSMVDLSNSSLLEVVGDSAFASYSGQVHMVGPFAHLTDIANSAFWGASNPKNNIVIACRAPDGLTVGAIVFDGYTGVHNNVGEQCSCNDPWCGTATVASATARTSTQTSVTPGTSTTVAHAATTIATTTTTTIASTTARATTTPPTITTTTTTTTTSSTTTITTTITATIPTTSSSATAVRPSTTSTSNSRTATTHTNCTPVRAGCATIPSEPTNAGLVYINVAIGGGILLGLVGVSALFLTCRNRARARIVTAYNDNVDGESDDVQLLDFGSSQVPQYEVGTAESFDP